MNPQIKLNEREEKLLSLLCSDSQSGNRGVWLYPFFQQMGYRGYSETEINVIIDHLKECDMVEYVEVPSFDQMERRESTAPAYKATRKAFEYLRERPDLMEIRSQYHYVLRLANSKKSTLAKNNEDIDPCNLEVLSILLTLNYVQSQTRFCLPSTHDDMICLIAIWAYEPISIQVISDIVTNAGASMVSFKEE